jgi:hypothetical protein
MNWDAIGAIAELLGAIGVIASLVYLATQIRQNTATVRASGSVAHSGLNDTFTVMLAQDDVSRDVWSRGVEGYESLTADAVQKFQLLLGLYMNYLQQGTLLRRDGALSDDAWSHALKNLRFIVSRPSFRHYWEIWGPQHADGFIALVEEIIGEEPDRRE